MENTELNIPAPERDALTTPYWEALDEGKLLLQIEQRLTVVIERENGVSIPKFRPV
jgi:hypothetical protein